MESKFVGDWDLISSENFDDYLADVGVGYLQRMMANTVVPIISISVKVKILVNMTE